MKSTLFRAILFIGILAFGISVTAYMMTHRITPERTPMEEGITPVSVKILKRSMEQVRVPVSGLCAVLLDRMNPATCSGNNSREESQQN